MMALSLLLVLSLVALAAPIFLLGFRLGGEHWLGELQRVRREAAHAERQIHDLTRQAFVSMAEEVERHRRPGQQVERPY